MKENLGHPKAFDITGVPTLFGVCVYSFMCQHSLPSLITPIRNKSYLSRLMAADYSVILVFYFLLCLTAIFAFDNTHLMDMYTLNFQVSDEHCVESTLISTPCIKIFYPNRRDKAHTSPITGTSDPAQTMAKYLIWLDC